MSVANVNVTVSMSETTYREVLSAERTQGYNSGYNVGLESCDVLIALVENVNARIPIRLEHLSKFIQQQRDLKIKLTQSVSFAADNNTF